VLRFHHSLRTWVGKGRWGRLKGEQEENRDVEEAISRYRQMLTRDSPSQSAANPFGPAGGPPSQSNAMYGGTTTQAAAHPPPITLPPPIQLAGMVEEARTSASMLVQMLQATPAAELLGNELIKEFVTRCENAEKGMRRYMNAQDPSPDEDTHMTLIETADQLGVSLSKYNRARLAARKALGISPSPARGNSESGTVPGTVGPTEGGRSWPGSGQGALAGGALAPGPHSYSNGVDSGSSQLQQQAPPPPQPRLNGTGPRSTDFAAPPGPPPSASLAPNGKTSNRVSSPPPLRTPQAGARLDNPFDDGNYSDLDAARRSAGDKHLAGAVTSRTQQQQQQRTSDYLGGLHGSAGNGAFHWEGLEDEELETPREVTYRF